MELEHPLLRVPYEFLNKASKAAEKAVEKDLGWVSSAISGLGGKENLTRDEASNSIDGIVKRLQGLKRKLEDTKKEEDLHLSRMRIRLEHLGTLEESKDKDAMLRWNKTRCDRILVDYLLRENFYESAQELARDSDIMDLVDIDVFLGSRRVIDALKRHDCSEALAWCAENKSRLKRNKSSLEFRLRLQEFVELVRARHVMEAIAYAKKHLAAYAATNMQDIQHAMASLAFLKSPHSPTFKELFGEERWSELVEQFHADLYQLHSLPTRSLLTIYLHAGLTALKTPLCFDESQRNINCPVCHGNMRRLAGKLPMCNHTHSTLVCRITGQLMNEDNPPMVLPNNHVYSRNALSEMAANNKGIITCPRTGATCRFDELKKAFIS